MWYYLAGAIVGIVSLIVRNPIAFAQAEYKFQGTLTAAVLGAAIFGTIFWVVGRIIL
jgi:hypothetical protein